MALEIFTKKSDNDSTKMYKLVILMSILGIAFPAFSQEEKIVPTIYEVATKGGGAVPQVSRSLERAVVATGVMEQQLVEQVGREIVAPQVPQSVVAAQQVSPVSVAPAVSSVKTTSVQQPGRVSVQNAYQGKFNAGRSAPIPPAVAKQIVLRRQAQQVVLKNQANKDNISPKKPEETVPATSSSPKDDPEIDMFAYFRDMGKGEIPEVGNLMKTGDPYEREKELQFRRGLTGTEAPGKNDKMSKDWWERQLLMSGDPLPYNWHELSYDQAVRFVQDVLQSKAAASQKSLFDIEKEAAQANLAPNRAPLTKEELRRKAQVIEAQSILADDFLGRSVDLSVENWARSKPDFIEDNWIWGDYEEPWNENVSSLRILMVNDIAHFFNKFKELAAQDSRVTLTTANNAQEAIDKLAANPTGYDIVMTDYHMPNKVGTTISMYVKENHLTMPVVVLAQANGMPSWWFKYGMSGRIDINHTAEEVFNYASNIVATGKAFPNR